MRKKFAYLRPTSVAEALELKAKYGAAAQFLAGGTDLIGEWRREVTAFDYVIDITRLSELSYIKEDGDLRVGALTTLAEIADATPVNALVICMSSAARRMATPQIRDHRHGRRQHLPRVTVRRHGCHLDDVRRLPPCCARPRANAPSR